MRGNKTADDFIYGRRPVEEALEAGRALKIFLIHTSEPHAFDHIVSLAKTNHVPLDWVDKSRIDRMVEGNHQGAVAHIAPLEFWDLDSILELALKPGLTGPAVLFLDGIQDPQNVGSILRSAYFFGVKGVVIPKWRASGVTGAVVRASAGAAQFIPTVEVSNLGQAIDVSKKKGLWIAGADMDGQDVKKADIPRPFGLVLGSEGEGLHQLVKTKCDLLIRLSRRAEGKSIDSLNVGAAASAFLHYLS